MTSFDTQVAMVNPTNATMPRPAVKVGEWPIIDFNDIALGRIDNTDKKPAQPCEVGVIHIGLKWIAGKAAKVPMAVKLNDSEDSEVDKNHELVKIWKASKPTKLIQRILDDLYLYGKGNALLLKVRNEGTKRVTRLVPINIRKCEFDRTTGLWKRNGVPFLPDNLIWISLGADPDIVEHGTDPWQGFEDDLRTLKDESAYTADVLANGGVVGLFISKNDPNMILGPDAIKRFKREAKDLTTGKNRGGAVVSGTGLNITEVGSSPERMALDKLTQGAQARVAANLRLALMVLGLNDPGKTYSNLEQATKNSYQTAVMAFHDLLADAIGESLLPETGTDPAQYEVVWDYDDQEEMQEDLDKAVTRLSKLVNGPIMTANEARAKLGEMPSDDPLADVLQSTVTPKAVQP